VLKHEPEDAGVKLAAIMLRPVELMLHGMALECLLKALRLKQGGGFEDRKGFRDFPGSKTHDLTQMADALRLKLSPREKDVLDHMTAFVRFGGRYPVPIRASESALGPVRDGGGMVSPTVESSGDDAIFEKVVAILKRELAAPYQQ